jgi:hypothetical protein
MNKSLTLTATAVLALAFGGASAATIQKSVSGKMAKPFVGAAAGKVLYEQSGNDSGGAVISQNFVSDYDQYDNASADDFTVPAGMTWKVSQVNVTGQYSVSGPAVSEHVTIFKDKGGNPGSVVADFPGLMGKDNGSGSFAIKLPSTVKLKPGKYWVSVQIDMDHLVSGLWFWQNQITTAGSAPLWQNPGNGYGVGCTTWMNEAACVEATGLIGDKMFTLFGK